MTSADDQSGDAAFAEIFGVSRDELRRRGIDPHEYALQNVHSVVKHHPDRLQRAGMPASEVLLAKSIRWGWRFYAALFVGFGLLIVAALKPSDPIRFAAIGLAIVALVVAVVLLGNQVSYYRRYSDACQQEGIQRKTMLGRDMPGWRTRR